MYLCKREKKLALGSDCCTLLYRGENIEEQFHILLYIYASAFVFILCQNSDLVWICVKVKVFQEACSKLAEQEVVRLIDGPHAPVCVVVGTGAGAERSHCKQESMAINQR